MRLPRWHQWYRTCLPMQETLEMPVQSPGQEDPLEDGVTTPLQYSCLENPMDRGNWRAIVHRVAKSRTWLKWLSSMHKHLWICFLFFYLFVSGQKKKFRGVCFFSAPSAHNWLCILAGNANSILVPTPPGSRTWTTASACWASSTRRVSSTRLPSAAAPPAQSPPFPDFVLSSSRPFAEPCRTMSGKKHGRAVWSLAS